MGAYQGSFGARRVAEFAGTTGLVEFWSKVRRGDGCWEWTGALSLKGYGKVWLQKGHGAQKRRRVVLFAHRVAWFLTHQEDPARLVLHRCDNKRCVRPDHLYVGTNADNMRDASVRQHKRSRKLDYAKAAEIRRRVAAGEPQKSIARSYGVCPGTVQHFVYRKTYMHAP